MYGVLLPPEQNEGPMLADDDTQPPPGSMAPPPPGEFKSREELLEYQKEWAESQGFAVVIGRSRPNRLWVKCDRGGEYADKHLHDPENRKRKRKATRLTGCPFNVKATMKKDKIWRCHTENGEHNHPPSEDLSIHPSLRRMTDEQLQKVNEMTESGNTPVETLDELQRLWPGIKVLRRDIYNARKKYKTEKELAEIAQGLHLPQPFEDPNGKMPGPTRTGRWEWLEDGDEVKRKKKRKVSLAAAGQANLAPELRDSSSPQMQQSTTRRQAASLGNVPPRQFQQPPQQAGQMQHQPSSAVGIRGPEAEFRGTAAGAASSSPGRYRQFDQTPQAARAAFRTPSQPTPNESIGSSQAPMLRTGADVAPMGQMVSPMMNTGSNAGAAGPKAPSGQVLMSRIERMEKEQNEQKNMLAQILNAVQGVGGMRR